MKNWRPKKGWKNPYLKSIYPEWEEIREAYEAGADAMLEALEKEAKDFIDIWGLPKEDNRKGHFLFIPDKEGKDDR